MPCPTYLQNFRQIRQELFFWHTDKQTNKLRQKHYLLGGVNYIRSPLICKYLNKNDASGIPFDAAKHLRVSEELGKVDVKNVSGMFDHNVVVVTVTDSKHVRSHAVTGATGCEIMHRLQTPVY